MPTDRWAAPRLCARRLFGAALLVSASILPAGAASRSVDLDGQTANGAESRCDLNVLATFPVTIENVVTNRAPGSTFDFSWPSAGPGGFTSSVTAGTTAGVGAKWTWSTVQTVYSYTGSGCANDICFLTTGGPGTGAGTCTTACLDDGVAVRVSKAAGSPEVSLSWSGGSGAYTVFRSPSPAALADPANVLATTDALVFRDATDAGRSAFYLVRGATCVARKSCASDADCDSRTEGTCTSRGPFAVPGRSLTPTDVTVSAASLTSSLITFFSPPREVFRITSTAQPGGVMETLANNSGDPVTITTEAWPPGCCPANSDLPHPLRCGDECIDPATDPLNCGACGNVCGEGTCCVDGSCASLCGEGRSWCDGTCADTQTDNANCGGCGNVCGDGSCCSGGACVSLCGEDGAWCEEGGFCADVADDSSHCGSCGQACADGTCCDGGGCVSLCGSTETWCGEECADLQNDSIHCGACGALCPEGTCCSGGACVSECPEGTSYCDGQCVDLENDERNCGACDLDCGDLEHCRFGLCTHHDRDDLVVEPASLALPAVCPNPYPTLPHPGVCPNPNPSPGPTEGSCPEPYPSSPVPGACPGPGPRPPLPESPVCEAAATTTTVPPGASATVCQPGALLYREVASSVSVCGDSIPGPDGQCQDGISNVSKGTYMRLVPDTSRSVGNAFLTPYAVHVLDDGSGDGMIGPGETVNLIVELLNAGPLDVTSATATLLSAPVDLTDDGVVNPVGVSMACSSSSYGTIRGTAPPADCAAPTLRPAKNSSQFRITVPSAHPGDSARPFTLRVHGTVAGSPFDQDVPFDLGVVDKCVYAAQTRDFDGVDGLRSPMTTLVPVGDTVLFPSKSITRGSTIPFKVKQLCGGENLRGADVDPPELIALDEETLGPISFASVVLNDDTNNSDPFFRWNDSIRQWVYNFRTSGLPVGTYTVKIRLAGRKDYVTGFKLR